ncbi:hypothetical protein HanHA300_Chr17g0668201 [Helianthus annuus]|nr:hypothetical protein HanHA300_Chr17g0668201 [Helianthus annuus]KAJ0448776.1 hypothetical protein HanHA89_Chr17g0720941 [Helianthus annuus]KAJ0633653.1 hypothetical protein HanLR1_Chr17g0679361 [Helianthus annuus]
MHTVSGMMAIDVFHGKPDLTCRGKANNFGLGFFGKRRLYEKVDGLVIGFPKDESGLGDGLSLVVMVSAGVGVEPSRWPSNFCRFKRRVIC